jgi:hypothetical protein
VSTTVFDVYAWNKLVGTYQTLNKGKAALYRRIQTPNSPSCVRKRTPEPGRRAPHVIRKVVVALCFVGIGGTADAQISVDSVTADINAVKSFAQDLKSFALQG